MIHIARNGKQEGPYSLDQVNALVASGKLKAEDVAWWEGCSGWVPVSSIPGLASSSVQAVYAAPQGHIAPISAGAVSGEAVQALRETRPWVLFIAILGIIGCGFMLLAGGIMLAVGFMGSFAGKSPIGRMGGMEVGFIGGIAGMYLVLGLFLLYPMIKLFKYSRAISTLCRTGSSADLENALRQQKGYWKFMGIMCILLILFNILMLVLMGGAFFTAGVKGLPSGGGTSPTPVTLPARPSAP